MVSAPRKCPGDGLGGESGTSGTSRPDLCAIPNRLDRMSAGQTGHVHGTNGTRPRDGCGPEGGVPRQISLCLLVFLFPLGVVLIFVSFLSGGYVGTGQMGSFANGVGRISPDFSWIFPFQPCRGTPCISENTWFQGILTGF